MSKEKNLVYLNEYGAARVSNSRIEPMLANDAWCGPAIDRLYEFEKLGMEPEEIEKQLKYLNVLSRCHENLLKDLAWYKGQHGVLQVQHSNQAASIRELFDENTKLREELRLVRSSIYGLAPAANKQLKTEIEELKKEIAERERNEERLHAVIKNQNEFIDELKGNSTPGLTCKQIISQQRERINDLKGRLKRKTDEYNEKILAMSVDMDKLQEEIETLKKDRDAYKETAEIYREKCIELETKPLTVEEFEDYLDDLAKKYDLTAFKSTNGCIHNVIFTDTACGLYSGKRIVFDLYIDLNKFSGSKDIMKVTENNLREKLHLEPLEDDRA